MTVAETTAPPVAFDVDAMLMYGWVADEERNVTFVSNSLRRWIRGHAEIEPANETLSRIDSGERVPVMAFLASLLDAEKEAGTPAMVDAYMQRLAEDIASRKAVGGRRPERCEPYRVVLQYHPPARDAQPLAGARFVRDSATLLASRWNSDRVDIVVVAIVERDGGWWRVKGFQGQLQEAWLRVSNRIVDGNRAGSIALMARNLSHNIGSHALFWVAANASKEPNPKELKDFLGYLQVRMELLAGFATSMPLSPITGSLADVVRRFRLVSLLLKNICRSESVTDVNIVYEGDDHKVVFFGGEIGIHAFYSILENCIRDSSKFAPRGGERAETLTMKIVATELDRFIQVDVFDEGGNFEENGPIIQSHVDNIRLADESGRLDPYRWGIKERFVCAAMLRGERPENFPFQETGDPNPRWLGTHRSEGKRTLEMVNVRGNCAWRFYLPKPAAETIIVGDDASAALPPNAVLVPSSDLEDLPRSTAGMTAQFVVLDGMPPGVDAAELKSRLPHRTYLRGGGESPFIRIDTPLEAIRPETLLRASVKSLLRTTPVKLVAALGAPDVAVDPSYTLDDFPVQVIGETAWQWPEVGAAENLIVFRRHPFLDESVHRRFLDTARARGIMHFETYSGRALHALVQAVPHDPRAAYRLVEAALTRILIIDERLDLSLNRSDDPLRRMELSMRGIEVRGAEFAGHAVHRNLQLYDLRHWGSGFHYVLLHRGVADKLMTPTIGAQEVKLEDVIKTLESHGSEVVMHSGRMTIADLPPGTKFVSLANVATWIEQDYSKVQIIDELFSLRKV